MKNRIIAFLLLVSMLFCVTSCGKGNQIPPKDKVLVREDEAVVYTDEGAVKISDGLVGAAEVLMPKLGYPAIKDKDREKIRTLVSERLIPIAKEIPIYESEMLTLIDVLSETAEDIDPDDEYTDRLGIIADAYARVSARIDAERLGELIYRLDLEWLNDKLEQTKERYDEYGFPFYLSDIEKYTALIADAKALGSMAFSDALSIIMFMASAVFGSFDINGGALSVKGGDVLVILKKQGEKFASLGISEREWQTEAAMCEELIPNAASSAIHAKLTWTLDDENYFTSAAALMTDVIDFYAVITSDISPEAADSIDDASRLAIAREICREAMKHTARLDSLLVAIENKLPPATEAPLTLMNTYASVGYAEFTAAYSATKDELILAIEVFVADATEENYEAMLDAALGFMAGVNPVVAYVYLYL